MPLPPPRALHYQFRARKVRSAPLENYPEWRRRSAYAKSLSRVRKLSAASFGYDVAVSLRFAAGMVTCLAVLEEEHVDSCDTSSESIWYSIPYGSLVSREEEANKWRRQPQCSLRDTTAHV